LKVKTHGRQSTMELAQKARIWTLWGGFAGLLALMCAMAIDSGLTLRGVAETSATLRKASRERDELLDQLRNDIHHSGTVLRDYLLEDDPIRGARQKDELEHIHLRLTHTLASYGQNVPASERQAFAELASHINAYWEILRPALSWQAAVRLARGELFLREVVIPRRAEVVDLVNQITALNTRDFDAGEVKLAELQLQFRNRITWMCVTALILGFVLAWVVMRRVIHLERETAIRYGEVEEAHRNLGRLSERLVNAQEEERRRIARELHDEIGQAVSASLVELGRLESTLRHAQAYGERLASMRRMLEGCVSGVRDMALLLRPSMLDDLGLVAALKWQARELTRRTEFEVRMVTEELADDLPDSHKTCVYRVVQEALNNCAKHSHATQVRVFVRRDNEGLSVTVQDDGVGFDSTQERGIGLLGMEERVGRLGGLFSIQSSSGHGTTLSIRVPLPRYQAVFA
jgi:signal transduction histidine kinase